MGTRKLLYSMAKNFRTKKNESSEVVKDANGDLLVDLEDIACRWRNHYDVLLNLRNDLFQCNDGYLGINEEDSEESITEQELERAIVSMRRGKAAMEDGLPVEVVATAGVNAVGQLLKVMQIAHRTESVPEELQKSEINHNLKKCEKKECQNYRSTTLLSNCGKTYSRIVERRLRGHVERKSGEWEHG